jgi:hypothetical protein
MVSGCPSAKEHERLLGTTSENGFGGGGEWRVDLIEGIF